MIGYFKRLFHKVPKKGDLEKYFRSFGAEAQIDASTLVSIRVRCTNGSFEIRKWHYNVRNGTSVAYFWDGNQWQSVTRENILDFTNNLPESYRIKDAEKVAKIIHDVIPIF